MNNGDDNHLTALIALNDNHNKKVNDTHTDVT